MFVWLAVWMNLLKKVCMGPFITKCLYGFVSLKESRKSMSAWGLWMMNNDDGQLVNKYVELKKQ